MKRILFIILWCLVEGTSVTVHAMEKPVELQTFKSKEPYGKSTLTWLLMNIYDISLWTDAPSWTRDSPFALSIVYNKAFSSEDLVKETIKQMDRLDGPTKTPERFKKQLEKLLPNVQQKDRITAYFVPPSKVEVYYNSQKKGEINDLQFFRYFCDIWLSSATESTKVRADLLKINQ